MFCRASLRKYYIIESILEKILADITWYCLVYTPNSILQQRKNNRILIFFYAINTRMKHGAHQEDIERTPVVKNNLNKYYTLSSARLFPGSLGHVLSRSLSLLCLCNFCIKLWLIDQVLFILHKFSVYNKDLKSIY